MPLSRSTKVTPSAPDRLRALSRTAAMISSTPRADARRRIKSSTEGLGSGARESAAADIQSPFDVCARRTRPRSAWGFIAQKLWLAE
ncbi:MAG: hypothetical protein BGP06_08680 [Rhizobiales bacterium 65-9]|nr:MAG: hypothetical protein BGP06_08680 [Rhizobiales bacterium 65-9]